MWYCTNVVSFCSNAELLISESSRCHTSEKAHQVSYYIVCCVCNATVDNIIGLNLLACFPHYAWEKCCSTPAGTCGKAAGMGIIHAD